MAAVTLKAVRKSFGSTEVVHGVDVAIADGEFCVLVGPSGCGKSTLLRMIAGLEDITDGEIAIGSLHSARCTTYPSVPEPARSRRASRRFIAGEPMKPATKRLTGCS